MSPAATIDPRAGVATRDLVFTFFGITWSSAFQRYLVMPEDRLGAALAEHPGIDRLLVCDPYRSVAGRAAARLRGHGDVPFPEDPQRSLHRPLRLRRSDPADPARSVARYEAGVRRAAARLGLERPAVITANPLFAGLGKFDWAGPVTYFAWDDWTASRPHERWWPAFDAAFERIRAEGRRVCAVSEGALDRVAPTGPARVIPNGIDPAEWTTQDAPPEWFAALPRPRLIYHGGIDTRLDVEQARAVAAAFPDGSLTFLGPVFDPDRVAPLAALPNVEFHGWVDRAETTCVLAAADVGLVPHVRNPLTAAMSPLKLYEYLAAGLPVAAVDLPPIRGVDPRVVLGPVGGDLVGAVRRALALGRAGEADRLEFVNRHSWASRFEDLLEVALAP